MKVSKPGFDFAVDPFKEAVAYETCLALDDSSEINLEQDFPSHHRDKPLILTQTLVEILEVKKSSQADLSQLQSRVEEYLTKQIPFSVCTQTCFNYPTGLQDAKAPLKLFYYKGDLSLLDSPCVSVVGSRQATPEGLRRAKRVSQLLIDNNFTIVSGLAKGVDTAALTVATRNKGRAVAVIGTPINEYYPPENRGLQDTIARNQLLISHVPFYRYANELFNSRRLYFPKRNVTMAALSGATVIIEAGETSGTHSQARAAIQQQRGLFIMAQCFENNTWPQKFIKQGAIKIENNRQLLAELKTIFKR